MARQHPELTVIGLGAQDSLDEALEFLDDTGTGGGEIDMLWDATFAAWPAFGVRAQPYWILYDRDGNEVASRGGGIDPGLVAETVAG